MKVLFTYYISSGGVETLNRHRCKALKQAGIECHLLYKQAGAGHQNIKGFQTYVMSNPTEILHLIRTGQYDLIVVCSDESMLELVRGSGYKGPLVFEIQGLGRSNTARRFFMHNHAKISRFADGILLPRTDHLIQLSRTYINGIPQFSFHNCFDNEGFHYHKVIHPKHPVIGWVGRIERNKNWLMYIKIGAELIKSNPHIQLWMFLDDTIYEKSQKVRFDQKIQQYNLSSHLKIHNNIHNDLMPDYYSQIADSGGLLCSTSNVEGFGYCLVEAMSCMCPVVTTDSDGVDSIVKDNVTGLFIENENISDATKKIKQLLANPNIRKRLSVNAKKHVNHTFSLNQYASQFMRMYKQLSK